MASGKKRLDAILVDRGFFSNSDQAARSVMAGRVFIKGQLVTKPGTAVSPDADISLAEREKFVGRGGLKLEAALDHFRVDPAGLVCVDIGASTGGFTDCLLQRGAALVHAVDVGHSQLHWRLQSNPRVISREGCNARYLHMGDLMPPPVLAVGDVSFISLTAILPAVFKILPLDADAIFLIKPQFEAPKGSVTHGGVIKDEGIRRACIEKIQAFVSDAGHDWQGCVPSPITGHDGNIEYLAHFRLSKLVEWAG